LIAFVMPLHSHSQIVKFSAILVLAIACLAEVMAYGTGLYLAKVGVFYRPQRIQGFDTYAETRHPILGWRMRPGPPEVDAAGSRFTPAFPDPAEACVSVYGDSFTWGSEVTADQAWPNLLSLKLKCRVSNFGVPGYGSDQAFLRFKIRDAADTAPIAVLVHLSENIMRNINRYRSLQYPGSDFQIKPRFTLDAQGKLTFVAPPMLSATELQEMVTQPEKHLADEYFLPGGDSGVTYLRFPYTVSLLRGLRHFHIRAKIARQPWYAEFYDPDHRSNGLVTTAEILKGFVDEAKTRGVLPIVAIMPTSLDWNTFEASQQWVYTPLVQRLRGMGIEAVDLGSALMAATPRPDRCTIFVNCSGHLSETGGERIAEIMAVRLRDLVLQATSRRPSDVPLHTPVLKRD
jgi:hypothetical protein